MSLYTKYAPNSFDEMAGNETEIKILRATIASPDHISCFLFTGDRGMGKTLSARLLAKELGAELREINASDDRGVDSIRAIIDECQYVQTSPILYVFDECHQLTIPAQEALLKIMQDTPENVNFAFCTTNPEKLKATFKSRCCTVQLKPLDYRAMSRLLRRVSKDEDFTVSIDLMDAIIANAEGSAREALVLLESILPLTEDEALGKLQNSEGDKPEFIELCRLALDNKSSWDQYTVILQGVMDTEPIRQMVLSYMSKVLLKGGSLRVAKIIELFSKPFYDSGKAGLILAFYRVYTL